MTILLPSSWQTTACGAIVLSENNHDRAFMQSVCGWSQMWGKSCDAGKTESNVFTLWLFKKKSADPGLKYNEWILAPIEI
jgi:hypothetical protein